ncbi:hemerythrin domain-containing protein [Rhodovulum sp. BSW8]|uniref:hemerythrin domain-containing protein n=1 Tax=Rhodovulum sp. BSW8 TaxID=2259645 RepID=UPI000DE2AA01|nr:hemerythrin domain-containing protein [Rhodovulum sp. BSW8]RBO54264.1 hemerythrin domain-containing protein [Rhodovulum sp. BSW8]
MKDDCALGQRTGLPETLRVLLADYPRDLWDSTVPLDGVTRFWLDRHIMFRSLLAQMEDVARRLCDGEAPPEHVVRAIRRQAAILLSELYGHHKIEDLHYFPQLALLEPRLGAGFEILDADHHALEEHLDDLATAVGGLVQAAPEVQHDAAGRLRVRLDRFGGVLDRHLFDEEEIVVPILLRHGEGLVG